MKLPNSYTQRELAEARKLPPPNEPFAAINIGFHETYTRLIEQVLSHLGDSVPVIVLIGDDATLLCDNGEQREQIMAGTSLKTRATMRCERKVRDGEAAIAGTRAARAPQNFAFVIICVNSCCSVGI
jgi:hypothetical protein